METERQDDQLPRELRWKTLSSRYVYTDKWFTARADSCEFPDGRIIEPYYVIELSNWCMTVVVTKDEQMIFVRQYRHGLGKITYELPGGTIEKGEDPLPSAKREVEEETGYTTDEFEPLMQVSPNPAFNNNTAYFFLARNAVLNGKQSFDPFEDIDVVSFSKEEVLQMLNEDKFQHGVQVGAIYKAVAKLGWRKEISNIEHKM